jgi:hypothetical protein
MRVWRYLTREARVPIRQVLAKASQMGGFQNSKRVGMGRSFPYQKGTIMPCTKESRILVAGLISPSTSRTLKKLEREGCIFLSAATIADAELSLCAVRFDIVLACEIMPDGRGYELRDSVVNDSANLLVAIALSETCLWLPVVQRGKLTLGERALHSDRLEPEIRALLDGKLVRAEHLAAPSPYYFLPESASHCSIAGLGQRSRLEERRGLRPHTGSESTRATHEGSKSRKSGNENSSAAKA